jgi:regulation of enolase protein 1 (concanavalin A-like superfamily)
MITAVKAAAPPLTPWITGWGKPADVFEDCRFDRAGSKLTITIPDRMISKRTFWPTLGHVGAPHLMREVSGDFRCVVRVSGNFRPPGGFRTAGILLWSGEHYWRATRAAGNTKWVKFDCQLDCACYWDGKTFGQRSEGTAPGGPVSFRLTRRGDNLLIEVKEAGKDWKTMNKGYKAVNLPKTLKMAVFAESLKADGTFTVVFDEFSLTPLK